jgi:hypothetical protein
MFLATTNRPKRLLHLCYIGFVNVAELERGYEELKGLLAEFPSGFRLLADLGRLESVDLEAVEIIGKTMELLEQRGLELIVRVVPDPSKDFGFKIIAIFHYKNRPRTVVCETMVEAARALGL